MVQQEFPWATVPRGVSFPPFSLIQNNIDRICASYCLSKTQSFATAHAKLCIRSCKALHLPSQCFASAIAMHCVKRGCQKNYNENENQNEDEDEDKNHDKPLEEDGGKALLSGFRFGLIRAVLLTPQA